MPSSRGIHMRGDRIKTRRGEISRAAPGKPALREAAARPGSSHGNSAHPLLSHSSTRNPSSPSHRGALPPISACGSFQRRRTSSACGNEKPAPKARTGRDPCCQLDGRGSLNLRSGRNYIILNLPLSSLQLELYQVNLKQGTKREGDGERERERGRERDTALARAAPALLGGASPGCLLWEHSGCRAALPSRPWPSARSSSLAQVQAARAAVAGSSALRRSACMPCRYKRSVKR